MPLFREEALSAQKTTSLGEIVLIQPLSMRLLTGVLTSFTTAVILFLIFGSYTQRTTVRGQLVPEHGLIKLYVPDAGIVVERRVRDEQRVKAGDILFVISGERQSALGATQAAISEQVLHRDASLRDAREKTRAMQAGERASLEADVRGLRGQAGALDEQISGQRERVALAEQTAARYRGLVGQGYISQEQADQKRADALDQRGQLQTLTRERLRIGAELTGQTNTLAELSLKQQKQIAAIDRELSENAEALSRSEARRRTEITAPRAGIVTAMVADVGQAVDARRPLAALVPAGTRLQAELYAPSRSIGTVRRGDRVLLRYPAYPYERWGQQPGVVDMVARTAMPADQLGDAVGARVDGGGEPLYRVTVSFDATPTSPLGQPWELRPGMQVEADLLRQRRRLYQWAFDPVQSLSGKL
ncbi:secretion protein [Pandoraea morbifera]|uniref:Secretion protein n=1 Tax=Pandoraea morbifera TaxID=2508300 RepID=A0A5E4SEI3_9BURK|nr:HlyD family efflux transporter periplasmic adaptor subunit [Pandoraea morbifera]VVD73513.1 secretion protein [Pandoraea morbifera]